MNATVGKCLGVVLAAMVTGCGAASVEEPPAVAPKWDTRVLASGVELRVREDASPDAVMTAEAIQSEMRARYIGARQ